MTKLTSGFKFIKLSLLAVLVAAWFLFTSVSTAYAFSFPSQTDVHAAVDQVQDNVDQFVERSQQTLTSKNQEIRAAIKALPDNLEAASAQAESNYRKAVLADLQAAQQKLEETAQAYEQYAQQADALEQEVLRSAKQSRSDLKAGTRQKVEDVKESLRLTSDAMRILADDAKQGLNDTTAFSKARVNQHTQALQQALDTSDKALKALFN